MMKKLMFFAVAFLFAFEASANHCYRTGYLKKGTEDINDIPSGFRAQECEHCQYEGIYYWRCKPLESASSEKSAENPVADGKVNCMDYLRTGDTDGFAKCTGLQGKWERRGNQLIRVE